ncbi:MAG: hypothetical protein CMP76_04705 [Flavobacterium sp.]|uniref:hypothetical protein n=1 Tax=Flavobacterium sp. TaxID=239 RepID=UPI000C41AC3F|nr:hypothetical protein [Flavobacterium sp.]MBF02579.1 hypothetical protein [Flavobacterium sp.]|tara:strand:+ start:22 stop:336 length:315 start_codon:yes stop_codon:yes gene_type:complete
MKIKYDTAKERRLDDYLDFARKLILDNKKSIIDKFTVVEEVLLNLSIDESKAFPISRVTSTHLFIEHSKQLVIRVDYHDYQDDEKPTFEDFILGIDKELQNIIA